MSFFFFPRVREFQEFVSYRVIYSTLDIFFSVLLIFSNEV